MKPAIVLNGHTMALGVARSLGSMGVPVIMLHYDERDMGHVSKYIKESIITPHPEREESQFIDLLMESSDRFRGGVLFPVSDETVVAVARHRDRLNCHFIIACPEWNVVSQYIDKKYTYALAEASGVPAPKTIIPQSMDEVKSYSQSVDYPCLIKPSQGHLFYEHFKRKMYPVDNADQMISVYQQSEAAGLEVMLQEIIPGDDIDVVNYNSYFEGGNPLVEFTAEHIRNAPPKWGSPRVAHSKSIPEVIEPGRMILQAMDFNGFACTEFKKDARDGVYKLMEVNGRHNLSTLLAVRCGINFPYIQYRHLVENVLPAEHSFKTGI
jgi:predicted ATP-grasp superfamily ATP-dependent carboligase